MVDWDKVILGSLGLVYVVSPIDVIPEAILGPFGLADDAAIAFFSVPLLLEGLGAEDTAERVK